MDDVRPAHRAGQTLTDGVGGVVAKVCPGP